MKNKAQWKYILFKQAEHFFVLKKTGLAINLVKWKTCFNFRFEALIS